MHIIKRLLIPATGLAWLVFSISGCGGAGNRDQNASLQHLAQECPTHGTKVASYVAPDLSGSSRSDLLTSDRREAIRQEANRVALCGGHLKVVGFSSGSAATYVLYEGDLQAGGATEQARVRRVDDEVNPVMATIDHKLGDALAQLPENGSDILSQFTLLREYFLQHKGAEQRGLILTDGVQTVGSVVTNVPDFTEAVAANLAKRLTMPELKGSTVTLAGIGQVTGKPPPEKFANALKVFFNAACDKTHATCLVVTDLSNS